MSVAFYRRKEASGPVRLPPLSLSLSLVSPPSTLVNIVFTCHHPTIENASAAAACVWRELSRRGRASEKRWCRIVMAPTLVKMCSFLSAIIFSLSTIRFIIVPIQKSPDMHVLLRYNKKTLYRRSDSPDCWRWRCPALCKETIWEM